MFIEIITAATRISYAYGTTTKTTSLICKRKMNTDLPLSCVHWKYVFEHKRLL